MFYENLGLKKAHNLKDLSSREQSYINYEERLLVGLNWAPEKHGDTHKEEGEHDSGVGLLHTFP